MKNEEYMRRAIELARRGEGLVNPNPMVGCVVVKDGRIVERGQHRELVKAGGVYTELYESQFKISTEEDKQQ